MYLDMFPIGSVGNLTLNPAYRKRQTIISRIGYVANWIWLSWELVIYHRSGILMGNDTGPFFISFIWTPLILQAVIYHHCAKWTSLNKAFWSSASQSSEIYDKINTVLIHYIPLVFYYSIKNTPRHITIYFFGSVHWLLVLCIVLCKDAPENISLMHRRPIICF